MRLRKIPGAEEYIYSQENFIVKDPTGAKGKWKEIFGNDNPIHVEFGTGKGNFIITLARRNPNVNYIGVEYKSAVLFKAMKKVEGENLPNLRFMLLDVYTSNEVFGENELDRLYLNFSDPWHKTRHARRRLTHRRFLEVYKNFIKEGGWVHFKTDNRRLFQFSLNEFAELGLKMQNISLDLHNDDMEDNVMTEYEAKFVKKGEPIFRVEVNLDNMR